MNLLRNRLQALILQNQKTPRLYEIRSEEGSDEATIYLYDFIDSFWGVSAETFCKDLNAIKAGTIHLRINSPGGNAFDGVAIYTALEQHSSKIIAHIDGLAASAASFIALAADEVEIAAGAMIMIHRGQGIVMGDRDAMLKIADLLTKFDANLVALYQRETGNTAEQIDEWLAAETWFNAEEAIEHGFADRLAPETASASARAQAWDLSAYDRAPAAPSPSPVPPPADRDGPTPEQVAAEQREVQAHRDRQRRNNRLRLAERTAN